MIVRTTLAPKEQIDPDRLNADGLEAFSYPTERFEEPGIVIPAGPDRYFTCAGVCIKMLRRLGCELPIEVWRLGPEEMDDEMRPVLKPLGGSTVGSVQLDGFSESGRTFALGKHADGIWRGRWEVYEKMPIELTPTELLASKI